MSHRFSPYFTYLLLTYFVTYHLLSMFRMFKKNCGFFPNSSQDIWVYSHSYWQVVIFWTTICSPGRGHKMVKILREKKLFSKHPVSQFFSFRIPSFIICLPFIITSFIFIHYFYILFFPNYLNRFFFNSLLHDLLTIKKKKEIVQY